MALNNDQVIQHILNNPQLDEGQKLELLNNLPPQPVAILSRRGLAPSSPQKTSSRRSRLLASKKRGLGLGVASCAVSSKRLAN